MGDSKIKSAESEMDGNTIWCIKNNYEQLEKNIVNQLYFKVPHGGEIGHYREKIWFSMFENIIPKKFVIEHSVFIIDSKGRVSREVDLAIVDEMYTPYIFKYGLLKFIPIEAVAVAVECKSTSLDADILGEWVKRIKALETSSKSIVRTINKVVCGETSPAITQTATRPLLILCSLSQTISRIEKENNFDVIIKADNSTGKLQIKWEKEEKDLYQWYKQLNHANSFKDHELEKRQDNSKEVEKYSLKNYQVHQNENILSLMTFNFQLNQLLMLINNPMLFPHMAYAEMFDKNGHKKDV